MKSAEAIEVIKSNYPPEQYTILREALDMAIKAIEDLEAEFGIYTNGK